MDKFLEICLYLSIIMLMIALLLAFIRLALGPNISNRIAAMDLIASIIVGFILLYSIVVHDEVYIDTVIVISLISFISTVAISAYVKQKKQ